jgi:anti-sigma28 factor (negative regulator of flagellin synthesis)
MMEINRIGGPSEPARIEREEVRRKRAAATPAAQDAVNISSEARVASNIVQFAEAIKNLPDIRQERVQQARENLERGSYRDPAVVGIVAERTMKYVINE